MNAPCQQRPLPALGPVFWRALAAVAILKAALLVADHAPNFYMGDSAAFIGTALDRWLPPQRSWTYGFFIRYFCLPVHSLAPLLIAQTLAGVAACGLLGACLRRFFDVSPAIAAGAIIACAADPLQLLHERLVMTESFSLAFLALVLAGSFAYCERPRLATLFVLQVLFLALISLRLQFLLPVGMVLMLLPLAGNAGRGQPAARWLGKALLHSVISIALMAALHGAYRATLGLKHRMYPAYSYGTSGMVICAFAPLLRPADAPSPALAAAIQNDSTYPLADRALRNDQLWNSGGLINRIENLEGGLDRADASERLILRRMAMRAPAAMLLFGLQNYAGYWDIPDMPATLRQERDSGPYDPGFTTTLLNDFHLDTRSYPHPALSKALDSLLPPWLVVLLASPLILLAAMFCAGWQSWRETTLLFLVGVLTLAQNTMLSTMNVYRYLQPVSFITLMALAIVAQRLFVGGTMANVQPSPPGTTRRSRESPPAAESPRASPAHGSG